MHTSGPWVVEYGVNVRSGQDGRSVASTAVMHGANDDQHENRDNARLISAAPDLLKIAQELMTWAVQKCPCHDETPDPCPLCGASVAKGACKAADETLPPDLLWIARAAIAKATGIL